MPREDLRWPERSRRRILEHQALVRIEGGIERIERHNGGEQRRLRRAAGNQIAFVREAAADAAVDGRLHLCKLEIEFRCLGRRLCLGNICSGDIVFVAAGVKLFRGYGAALHQLLGALKILQERDCAGLQPA